MQKKFFGAKYFSGAFLFIDFLWPMVFSLSIAAVMVPMKFGEKKLLKMLI
jgi:hypothetical protein